MYLGKIVELAARDIIYETPIHPYTQALLNVIPIPHPQWRKELQLLQGELPSLFEAIQGCRFHSRCDKAKEMCREQEPLFKELRKDHWVACHLC